jgi:hypothetical protein
MPDVSGKQHRFMEGIAHGMKPRGGKGPSVAVAQEFVQADKAEGKHFAGPKHPRSHAEFHALGHPKDGKY